MSPRPVLGIVCDTRIVGTETAQTVVDRYVTAAMRHADAAALLIPALPDHMRAEEVAPRIDGLLLTGSPSNIAPERYGHSEGYGPYDPGRDSMAAAMIAAVTALGKPVFGVCRGFQEINVALGGTLRRDLGQAGHHAPAGVGFDAMFEHVHPVALREGGILARAYRRPHLEVNSVHYQGVETLAPGLAIEAEAEDGVVEAFSARVGGAPVLAVQWHPEWRVGDNPDSQTFFTLLGSALRGKALASG